MKTNYIKCGNCLDLLQELPHNSIDCIVTSPPYDNLRAYGGYEFDFEGIAKELYRVMKPNAVMVWVVGDSTSNGTESGTSFKQALYFTEIGLNLHDTMIYQKINYIPLTHNRYEQCFEYMFVLSKGKPKTFNPILIPCKNAGKIESYGSERRKLIDNKQAMRSPNGISYKATKEFKYHSNIFSYTVGASKTGHPAPFPDKLAEDQILSWSNENDIILDPFMGSGTTALMALKHNRKYIGFELNPDYCKLAQSRIDNYTNNSLFCIVDQLNEK